MVKDQICHIDGKECYIDMINSLEEGIFVAKVLYSEENEISGYAVIELNKALEEIFKINRENILGKTLSESFVIIGADFMHLLNQAVKAGSVASDENTIAMEIGDRHFRVKAKALSNGNLIVSFYDTTDKVKAEKANEKYLMLFENALDVILYLREDGSIIEANKTAVNKYGYSYEELLCMNIQQIRHSSMRVNYKGQMEESAFRGIVFEGIHMRKDGSTFPVEVSSRSVDVLGDLFRIHIIRDITERKEAEDKIRYLANYDALTGIPNRGNLMRELQDTIKQSSEDKLKFAVMLFDVDKFKAVNDTYGHNTGDEVLKAVAERLKAAVKAPHMIGRLGGDEFFVIQKHTTTRDEIYALAKHIHEAVCRPLKLGEITLDLRISLGAAIYPEASLDSEGLMHCADSAMYSVKQKGGRAFEIYGIYT